jgi:hypothetical protein
MSSNPSTAKRKKEARHQCLTFVILATWEAEIERNMVQDQPGKKFMRPPFQWKKNLGVVTYTCHPTEGRKCRSGKASVGKKRDPISKITGAKWTGGMTQCKALSSYPSIAKKKKKNRFGDLL